MDWRDEGAQLPRWIQSLKEEEKNINEEPKLFNAGRKLCPLAPVVDDGGKSGSRSEVWFQRVFALLGGTDQLFQWKTADLPLCQRLGSWHASSLGKCGQSTCMVQGWPTRKNSTE